MIMDKQKKHQIVTIQSVDPKKISFKDFESIAKLEQDMRARKESF
jgi:hypothetical protein